MRLPFFLFAICALGLPLQAAAQRSPVLVELFTSQGCSACPPADAVIADLAQRPGVIALSLHVDYWDYLGWKDSFGLAAHTKRQRAYAKVARERSIYTPQIIVQGVDRAIGSDRDHVMALVAAHQGNPALADLSVERKGDMLRIRITPTKPTGLGPSDIYLVRFVTGGEVAVEHGENAGHMLPVTNAVTEWSVVALWDGLTPADFEIEAKGPAPVAVIVQRERLGPVLSAAILP